MADDPRAGRGYNPRDQAHESQYPPPPGQEEEQRAYPLPPPSMARGMVLPSIQDSSAYAGPPPSAAAGYAHPGEVAVRGAYPHSPPNANGGYPPPGHVLPPLPSPPEQRQAYDYYASQQRPPAYATDPYGYGRYLPPGPLPPPGYGGYPADYPRVGATAPPPPQQAAPRQRTSIACRYCRKRKIRCSGYATNTTNGKCTNCDKLRIDCVFQPVSSNSSAAFVPVTAVPGGVPPGTPLYGAYGQPLPPAGASQAPAQYPGHAQPGDYALPSPSSQYPNPSPDGQSGSRRRNRRQSEEGSERRLPPPSAYGDDDLRRRSPASTQSSSTPPAAYHQYGPPSVYDPEPMQGGVRRSSSGGTPASQSSHSAPSNPMSLDNLVGPDPRSARPADSGHDIDQSMLGRLNWRPT